MQWQSWVSFSLHHGASSIPRAKITTTLVLHLITWSHVSLNFLFTLSVSTSSQMDEKRADMHLLLLPMPIPSHAKIYSPLHSSLKFLDKLCSVTPLVSLLPSQLHACSNNISFMWRCCPSSTLLVPTSPFPHAKQQHLIPWLTPLMCAPLLYPFNCMHAHNN